MANVFKGAVKTGEGGSFAQPEEGQHLGIVCAVIDLGTHTEKGFQGAEDKDVRKVFIGFELPNETNPDTGKAFVVGREYTLSTHVKSALVLLCTKVLRGGRAYSEHDEIDFTSLLGKPCQVLLEKKKSASGREYVSIRDVTSVLKGTKAPTATYSPVLFVIDEDEGELHLPEESWLPYTIGEPISEKIKRSPEWRKYTWVDRPMPAPEKNGFANAKPQPVAAGAGALKDIPF